MSQTDALAQEPGLAVGFKLPGRASPDYIPAAVLAEVLAGGNASRFHQGLVKGKGVLSEIWGGLNWPLGNAWQIEGPTMMTFFGLYKPETDAKAVVAAMGDIIARIAKEGVPAGELARVKTNLESNLYAELEDPLSRADMLALSQLFMGDAAPEGAASLRSGQAAARAEDPQVHDARGADGVARATRGLPEGDGPARRARWHGLGSQGEEGITELLASTLREGTATRTSRQIAEELQSVGGSLQVNAADDAIYLQADGLASGTETVLSVVADVARNASFPAQEVALAKGNVVQVIQAKDSEPWFTAQKVFAQAVFGKHPYRIVLPDPAVITAATPDLLKKEFSRRFRPEWALLLVVGSFDAQAVSQVVTKSFGGWKGSGPALPTTPPVPAPRGREILFVSRPGSVQSVIMIGRVEMPASDPSYFPSLVANGSFGGGSAGRLMENIREDKGYSYSPGSSLTTYQQGGALQIDVEVRNEVTAATLLELIYELDRMGAMEVTAEELKTAQRLETGKYLLANQSQGRLARLLGANWVKGLPPEFLGEYVPKVNAVTAAQVREAGRKLFASSGQTIVIVGDDKVKAELEQFGPVRVVKP